MQFQILGCGTSTGVPVPGCTCAVCTSTDPKNNRLRTAGLLTLNSGETILLDAGNDIRMQCLRAQVKRVDGVLLTQVKLSIYLELHVHLSNYGTAKFLF